MVELIKSLFIKNSSLFKKLTLDKVIIYHDESTSQPFAHSFLVIPTRSKNALISKLYEARDEYKCDSKLRFSDISGSKETKKDKCMKKWIGLAVEGLRQKGQKRSIFPSSLNCKFFVIFMRHLSEMEESLLGGEYRKEKELRKYETLLRIGLKGGLHYCYSSEYKVKLVGFITDGMPWHRNLDDRRILDKLHNECREYVEIPSIVEIKSVFSNHKDSKCTNKDDAQLLQLCDLLLGATIHSCERNSRIRSKKEILSRPVRNLINKTKRGRYFKRSGHYKAFSISKGKIVNNLWQFQQITTRERTSVSTQKELFNERIVIKEKSKR